MKYIEQFAQEVLLKRRSSRSLRTHGARIRQPCSTESAYRLSQQNRISPRSQHECHTASVLPRVGNVVLADAIFAWFKTPVLTLRSRPRVEARCEKLCIESAGLSNLLSQSLPTRSRVTMRTLLPTRVLLAESLHMKDRSAPSGGISMACEARRLRRAYESERRTHRKRP